jgi:hypothetical protein
LEAVVPGTKRVQPVKRGKKLTLEFTQARGEKKHLKFDSSSMSDGTLRALGLLVCGSLPGTRASRAYCPWPPARRKPCENI